MQLHRPFLPASRFVLALTAATSRDYQYFRQIQQARSRAYRTVHSTELDKISFPRTQLVLRYSSPVPPTKSLRNSIDSTFARATSDRRIYFRTRNKQIVPEMAAGGKSYPICFHVSLNIAAAIARMSSRYITQATVIPSGMRHHIEKNDSAWAPVIVRTKQIAFMHQIDRIER